ncbi:sugar kinase [Streptomyces sp. NPDC101132]|uniref:sugar kinase n=1 Tax=Streptomyces sp. NPDC101132 TaxID=3366110 RepID=UPI00381CA4A5
MDLVAVGESMVALRPAAPGAGLADADAFVRSAGGAESNVACALAAAGHRTRWLSRVGDDAFGRYVTARVAAYGVDVSGVVRDPARPTGIYFRTAADRAAGADGVAYYRAGSAASAMAPGCFDPALLAARVLHLTGITAALSASCADLLLALTGAPRAALVSFDLNHRRALRQDPGLLLTLARRAGLVFAGADEAAALWGATGPAALRALLPEPAQLVVKDGARGATLFTREAGTGDTEVFVPAPRVEVVAATGAGDGFAAGYLAGVLRGLRPAERLRLAHRFAGAALATPGDVSPPGAVTAPAPAATPATTPAAEDTP